MTTGETISIVALLFTILMAFVNTYNIKKTQQRAAENDEEKKTTAAKEEATQTTSILIALDNIKTMLSDIKAEINTVKADTKDNHDKLLILEQSFKSEHKRLDSHEDRLNSLEELARKVLARYEGGNNEK